MGSCPLMVIVIAGKCLLYPFFGVSILFHFFVVLMFLYSVFQAIGRRRKGPKSNSVGWHWLDRVRGKSRGFRVLHGSRVRLRLGEGD